MNYVLFSTTLCSVVLMLLLKLCWNLNITIKLKAVSEMLSLTSMKRCSGGILFYPPFPNLILYFLVGNKG